MTKSSDHHQAGAQHGPPGCSEALSRNSGQLHKPHHQLRANVQRDRQRKRGARHHHSRSSRPSSANRWLTCTKLQTFATNTDPLDHATIKPVAHDLRPTLHSVRLPRPPTSADCSTTSRRLINVSKKGLPALQDTLRGLPDPSGLLDQTGPFLSQTQPHPPIYLELYQKQGLRLHRAGARARSPPPPPRRAAASWHYLRQIGPFWAGDGERVSDAAERRSAGNTYPTPTFHLGEELGAERDLPQLGRASPPEARSRARPPHRSGQPPNQGTPPCGVAGTIPFQGQNQR